MGYGDLAGFTPLPTCWEVSDFFVPLSLGHECEKMNEIVYKNEENQKLFSIKIAINFGCRT